MEQVQPTHRMLSCGIELSVVTLPGRHTVAGELRVLTGFVHEPADRQGLNYIVEESMAKATQQRSGRDLSDAFDALGARWSSYAGREASGFHFTCLPEFLDDTLALHAEYITQPRFDTRDVEVSVGLTLDEMSALEDDAQDLAGVLLNRQVYGPVLGRHVLGERAAVEHLTADDARSFWKRMYHAGRMQVTLAGPVDADRVAERLEALFEGFGSATAAGREPIPWTFEPATHHHHKDVEQQQIGICYPAARLDDPRRYAQRAMIAVLSGGMSSRLFTELRERQGLVYWVTAWTEHPRDVAVVYLGASTKPGRAEQTYATLLGEVERLADDLTDDELRRAIYGMTAKVHTRGDLTRSWCGEVADSVFHHGRIVPREERLAGLNAVTVADVRAYLAAFPPRPLNALTLGPHAMNFDAVKPARSAGVEGVSS